MPFLFISCFYIRILVFEIALHRKRIPKSMQSNLLLIPLHLKWKKIQGLFKDLHRNSRTFQGKMAFKDFSRTHPEIQGLFKTVRTLLYIFYRRCDFQTVNNTDRESSKDQTD